MRSLLLLPQLSPPASSTSFSFSTSTSARRISKRLVDRRNDFLDYGPVKGTNEKFWAEKTAALKVKAASLGLGPTFVTSAAPPSEIHKMSYLNWIGGGMEGSMGYMSREDRVERRFDIERVLPGARTIIVTSLFYWPGRRAVEEVNRINSGIKLDGKSGNIGDEGSDGRGSRGAFASYAWGKDYHLILPQKLRELAEWLHNDLPPSPSAISPSSSSLPCTSSIGGQARWYVDTGAVLERSFGDRSGLGFIGKNAMLISPRFGSGFVMGEIISTLPLLIDDPIDNAKAFNPNDSPPPPNTYSNPGDQTPSPSPPSRSSSSSSPQSPPTKYHFRPEDSHSTLELKDPERDPEKRRVTTKSRAGCGKCTKCRIACPTGAIVDDRVVDSRKCISYLTIEHRGSIPTDLRGKMGNKIFGCDICQVVCPWNKFDWDPSQVADSHKKEHDTSINGKPVTNSFYSPLFGFVSKDYAATPLGEILIMSEEEFERRFRETPVMRIGLKRLHRNALVALGNSRNSSNVKVIDEFLAGMKDKEREGKSVDTPEALLFEHAAWALEELKKTTSIS